MKQDKYNIVADLEDVKSDLRLINYIHENVIADDFMIIMDNSPFVQDYAFDSAFRSENNHHILLVKSGWTKHVVNYQEYTTNAKSVVFIPAGSVISVEEFSKDFRASIVTFKTNDLYMPSPFQFDNIADVSIGYSEYETLYSYLSLINRLVSAPSKQKSDFDYLLFSLIMRIKYLEKETVGAETKLFGNRKQELVADFMKLINSAEVLPRKIRDYSKLLNTSDNYLSVALKEITGHTVMDLVNKKSLMQIKNSLSRPKKPPLQELSKNLGFSSSSQLIRFFKHHTGQTPGEYRKEVRAGDGGQKSKVKGRKVKGRKSVFGKDVKK